MHIRTMLIIMALLSACSLAGAEMYQWVDENGSVTFKDSPPPVSKKNKKVKVYTDSDFDPAPSPPPVPEPRAAKRVAKPVAQTSQNERFTGTIEIYVTEWCGYCKKAQKYMKDKGIPYVAYDIEKDSAAMQRHKDLGGRGVPLIVMGSRKMSGFSQESFENFLHNSR